MMHYTVFDNDGKILRTGTCLPDQLELQGANVIEGLADHATQYIADGVVVNKPPKPTEYHTFNYATKTWEDVATLDEKLAPIRKKREALLRESDWTQMPDSPLTTSEKAAWAVYRQSLRDITDGITDLTDSASVVFPIPPA